MKESLKNEFSIREYLLGRISEENLLAEYEELLFLDEEFGSLVEIAEDGLIDDFIFERLNENDLQDFRKTLVNNRERSAKIALTEKIREKAQKSRILEEKPAPILFQTLTEFFKKPLNAASFAVVLIGISILSIFLINRGQTDEITELKSIYKQERPTETRLSEFDYAPLVVIRGTAEEREKSKLRRIENELLEAAEKAPSAENLQKLGIFNVTQRKFDEAVEELEKAVKLDARNAEIRNDLGSAYFEKAKTLPNEQKLETLAKALENFSVAFDLDPNLLAALFNKSLCLQELQRYNPAKEAWNLYLEKDNGSGWAAEARKNLERLELLKNNSKTKEQILEDFLTAYRNRDEEKVWKIHSQTRETISERWLPDQISRRFLEAEIRGDDANVTESIEALKFIGNLERDKNADFFVIEIADFYAKTENFRELLTAKNFLSKGFQKIFSKEVGEAKANFVKSAQSFEKAGNLPEKMIAELWIAHMLNNLSEIDKSNAILMKLSAECERKNYLWLNVAVMDWYGNNLLFDDKISRSIEIARETLKSAEKLNDSTMQMKLLNVLAGHYDDVGETKKTLAYLSKSLFAPTDYNSGQSVKWQNTYYIASVFDKLKLSESAEIFGKDALFITRNSSLKESQAFDDSLKLLLKIYKNKKDFRQALIFAEESLQTAEKTQDKIFRKRLIQYATLEIAELKRATGEFDEALLTYEKVIELLKTNPEIQIDRYSAEKGKLLCLFALGRKGEISEQLEKTLELSEKYRSSIFDEETRNVFFENEQIVYDIAVKNAVEEGNPQKAFEFAEKSKARNLLDFVQGKTSVSEIEKKYPEIAKPVSFKEIQAKIPPNVQIAEYFQVQEKLFIWIVTRESFEFVEKSVSLDFVESKTNAFLQAIISKNSQPDEFEPNAEQFFEILVEPLLSDINPDKTLVIIADKSLYKLPFAALVNKKTKRFMVEDFTILYSPSANVFIKTTENAKSKENIKDESLLAVGNPQFDANENPNLNDLPSAGIEARKIAEFYPKNDLFIGSKATKEAVMENISEKNIFHFAGHYVTNVDSTPNSKILLAKTSSDSDLQLSELVSLRLKASKIVILSACDTNGEKVFQGEGAIGIAQSFLAIGAPVVVASNWKVDSETAKDLMIAVHRNRKLGMMNVSEALRQAQLEMLRNNQEILHSPYFWAAFSVIGGFTDY
ncbi:MAG: CHAT domain-containing protein [Pyrinomonadaceae bacterium]|nr:CHAT domain-containing protein [Pyrinomonadaceae bacterium]